MLLYSTILKTKRFNHEKNNARRRHGSFLPGLVRAPPTIFYINRLRRFFYETHYYASLLNLYIPHCFTASATAVATVRSNGSGNI